MGKSSLYVRRLADVEVGVFEQLVAGAPDWGVYPVPGAFEKMRSSFRRSRTMFAIKAEVHDPDATTFEFAAQKTMYGGKRIARGDTVFIFASASAGGAGLVARGVVAAADPIPKRPGVERQTPRVSILVQLTARARRRLGRDELRPFADWGDGRPETELNFKFYRQATSKIVGISQEAAAFLQGFF